LSFCTSPDNTVFHDLYHTIAETYATNEVIIPAVTPNSAVVMPTGSGDSFNWVKLRSGNHAAPVVQSADRVFQIIVDVADAAAGGVAGPTGPSGAAGAVGATGAGATGPQGIAGPTGSTGTAGIQGATGPTGTFNFKGTIAADNAAAGNIGEVIATSTTVEVALTTGVTANIATLALTPGDWAVSGAIVFDPVTATTVTALAASVSTISATLPTLAQVASGIGNMTQYALPFTKGVDQYMQTGICRINVSAPTSVYLVGQGVFSGGTMGAAGYISARRVR
jgi:hypothetical protein